MLSILPMDIENVFIRFLDGVTSGRTHTANKFPTYVYVTIAVLRMRETAKNSEIVYNLTDFV